MNDKYKDWLLISGKSWSTAQNYICRIDKVLNKIPETEFNSETLTAFLRDLQKDNAISTVNSYLIAIISYLKFIKKEAVLPKFLRDIKTLPKSFDEKEFEHIIDVLSSALNRDFLKYKALLYFLFYTGIRISEIDTLKRSHFELDKKIAKIYVAKTKEERMVVYTENTKDALKEYFDSDEEQENAFNVNSNAVKQRMKDWKKYFPEINLHPHLFRHSFAVHCLIKGVDLLTVSRLLGHKNTKTTERYLGLTNTQFQDIYRKMVDNKGDSNDRPKA